MMFWDSVFNGLGVLLYWETYVAGILYFVTFLIPLFTLMYIANSRDIPTWIMFIAPPLFQIVPTILFVFTMYPIIFGFGADASWSFAITTAVTKPHFIILLSLILLVLTVVLSLIPIIGEMPNYQTLIVGGFSLVTVLVILNRTDAAYGAIQADYIPSFWYILGFLIVGVVVTVIGGLIANLAIVLLARGDNETAEMLTESLAPVITSLFGLLPVCMYGAWLGLRITPYLS